MLKLPASQPTIASIMNILRRSLLTLPLPLLKSLIPGYLTPCQLQYLNPFEAKQGSSQHYILHSWYGILSFRVKINENCSPSSPSNQSSLFSPHPSITTYPSWKSNPRTGWVSNMAASRKAFYSPSRVVADTNRILHGLLPTLFSLSTLVLLL